MRTLLVYIFPLVTALLFSVSCDNASKRTLDHADEVMISNPDSALYLLNEIDVEKLSGHQRARYAVLRAKAQTKTYTPIDDETSLNLAVDYFHNRSDSLEVQALYYHGRALQDIGKEGNALARFTMAYDLASLNGDYFFAAMAARGLHDIYSSQYVVDEGLKWAKEEKINFEKAGYNHHAQWADVDIVESLIQHNSVHEAAITIDSASKQLLDDNKDYRIVMMSYKASNLKDQGRYAESLEIYTRQEEEGVPLNAGQLCNVAECRMALGDISGAGKATEIAKGRSISTLDSLRVYRMEAEIMAAEGEYKEAFRSAMKFAYGIMADGDTRMQQPYLLILTETLRVYYLLERQLNTVLHRNTLLLTVLAGALLAAIIFLLLWRVVARRLRKKEIEVLGLQADAAESDVNNMDAVIHTLLGEPLVILNRLCERMYTESSKTLTKGTKAELKHELSHLRSDETFLDIEEVINNTDDNWMKRFDLLYPGTPESNRRLVMLLYLGFSSAAIALLTDRQSQSAVYSAKSRLKRHLGLNSSPEGKAIMERLGLA